LDWEDAAGVAGMLAGISAATLVQLGPAESSIVEEYRKIPMRDGFQSTIKVHRPAETPSSGSPLIVLLFGGGFISGDKDQMTPLARSLVRLFGATAVTISYRLGPQVKWPVQSNDAWDSVKWLAEHASEVHADPSKGFVVGGISAGGISTAAVVNLSIQEKLSPPITGQWLSVPGIMDAEHVPEKYKKYFLAREHNKEAPILDVAALNTLTKHNGWDSTSELRFPILFKDKIDFSKLPPTYVQACGLDPLRDDALIYEEVLREAGVKTKWDLYYGAPHAHWGFMPGLEISNKALADIMINLGWLLGKEVTAEQGLKALAGGN
jgi:acetyl esterase/lipase